jgi:hypothetical protein
MVQVFGFRMKETPKIDPALRRRLRQAEAKLRAAQLRLSRTERSILYWTRILAELRHERTRAVQPALWPEDEIKETKPN